jgi:hypothetical protein
MIDTLIYSAINVAKKNKIDIYTFSLYYSHEDRMFSICIDTKENSDLAIMRAREFDIETFNMLYEIKDYDLLETNTITSGRNLSLGDFKYRNIVKSDGAPKLTKKLILAAMATMRTYEPNIRKLSSTPDEIVLSVTSLIDEFGIGWWIAK